MTPDEFMAQQKGDALAYAQNLVTQRDDALARIAAFDAKYSALEEKRTADLADLQEQQAAQIAQMQQDQAAALAKKDDDAAAATEALNIAHSLALVKIAVERDGFKDELTAAKTLIDAMGGTAVGQQLAHDKKRADAVKRKADADAASAAAATEIATLDNPPKE